MQRGLQQVPQRQQHPATSHAQPPTSNSGEWRRRRALPLALPFGVAPPEAAALQLRVVTAMAATCLPQQRLAHPA